LALGFCLLTSQVSALPLYRDSLPNGLIVLTYEDPRLPTSAVSLACRSGATSDPEGKSGTAAMMADLLTQGTTTMSGDSVKSIVEFLGARFSGGAEDDYCGVNIRSLSKDLSVTLDLLADAVLNPAFAAAELEIARSRMLADARSVFDDPGSEVSYTFGKLVFGDKSYGRLTRGDTTSIPSLRREDIVAFHRVHFRPNNCFVVAVGDVNRSEFVAAIEQRLGSWTPSPVTRPSPFAAPFPDRIKVKLITRTDMNQTYVEFGHPGITATDSDWLATRLMSYILGGSPLSSRLGITVREEAGLAYDVRCWFDRNALPGAYHATVQTAKPKEAIEKMMHDIQVMCDSGATRAELEKAHNYFTGSFPLSYANTMGKLTQVRTMELHGYGMDWLDRFPDKVRAVTLQDVNKAARDNISPGKYWMVILGPVTKEELGLEDVDWLE
jgi:zinc protease